MGDDAQIDDEFYDRIYECMLMRLRDKTPIVRLHAVFALSRLQDPSDVDCPIINGTKYFLGIEITFLGAAQNDTLLTSEVCCSVHFHVGL